MDDLTTQKLQKAIQSIHRAIENIEKGDKFGAVGDLNFCRENCEEVIYLIIAEIQNSKIN